MRRISGSTNLVGIIGGSDQVLTSLSPPIHNAAFDALGLDWVYLSFPVPASAVESAIRGLSASGIRGLNVTMPHKIAAADVMDVLEGDAKAVGAVNTIEMRGETLIGWNTDVEGFTRYLRLDLGYEVMGKRALVLGSGGAARAVVASLNSGGASEIAVAARDRDRALELESMVGVSSEFSALALQDAAAAAGEADLIVNATPVGQLGESPLLDPASIRIEATVIDLIYHPPATPLISAARSRGASAHNGLGMLLHQAALAFEIWTGTRAPLEAMSAAALGELRHGGGPEAPDL